MLWLIRQNAENVLLRTLSWQMKMEKSWRLRVSLDADDMVARLSRKYTALMRVYQEMANTKKDTEAIESYEKRLEMLGNAVVELLEAVFGEEDTKTIVPFMRTGIWKCAKR